MPLTELTVEPEYRDRSPPDANALRVVSTGETHGALLRLDRQDEWAVQVGGDSVGQGNWLTAAWNPDGVYDDFAYWRTDTRSSRGEWIQEFERGANVKHVSFVTVDTTDDGEPSPVAGTHAAAVAAEVPEVSIGAMMDVDGLQVLPLGGDGVAMVDGMMAANDPLAGPHEQPAEAVIIGVYHDEIAQFVPTSPPMDPAAIIPLYPSLDDTAMTDGLSISDDDLVGELRAVRDDE